ncbi:MAG: hypothetical protein ACR2JC_14645 [Chloroflexota bacterium]
MYFWRDGRGRTLYIGKAVNLRARVTSYFSRAQHDSRARALVKRARSIDHELASTELQALFRESALIKQVRPELNRALLTARTAHYLKFDTSQNDPFMQATTHVDEDGCLYFGPFRTVAVLRETMSFLHAALPLRKCTRVKPRCKPCLYYQMHTCAAPVLDEVHRQQHWEAIGRLYDLLDGRGDLVVAWLESKRDRLSEALMFERAADIQVRLDALNQLLSRQMILEAAVQCRCVLIAETSGTHEGRRLLLVAHGSVMSIRTAIGSGTEDVVPWVRAHEPLIDALQRQQSDVDAAGVLERWLRCKRHCVRWIAIPHRCEPAELRERIQYVLDTI